jgi:hypothetical protein
MPLPPHDQASDFVCFFGNPEPYMQMHLPRKRLRSLAILPRAPPVTPTYARLDLASSKKDEASERIGKHAGGYNLTIC